MANICADPGVSASKLTILFDSGIRTGSDVIKAMAIGADAVLIGRPYMYGLAVNGQQGVEDVLKALKADLEITMGATGLKTLNKDELSGILGVNVKAKL